MSRHAVEIFKLQVPVMTNDPNPKALVYNKRRTKEGQVEITDKLMAFMKGRHKIFIYATFNDGDVDLKGEAPWQEW